VGQRPPNGSRMRRRVPATPVTLLADDGYATSAEVAVSQGRRVDGLVATGVEAGRHRHDFRPQPAPRLAPTMRSTSILPTPARLGNPRSRVRYRLRKQAVEPVCGILELVTGFTHFHLRGIDGPKTEWQPATFADNCRHLKRLAALSRVWRGTTPYDPAFTYLRASHRRNTSRFHPFNANALNETQSSPTDC